jgi:hypothetical protein
LPAETSKHRPRALSVTPPIDVICLLLQTCLAMIVPPASGFRIAAV